MSWFSDFFKRLNRIAPEIPSPRDIIPQSDISYSSSRKTITIENIEPEIWLTSVKDTNSMDAMVDAGHTCILTSNFNVDDLVVGDVVVYKNWDRSIIHRIVKIAEDSEGKLYTMKGDNCYYCDPPVRDSQIKYLLLGIIY